MTTVRPRRARTLPVLLLASTSMLTVPVGAEQVFEQAFKHSTSEHRGAAVGDLDGNGTPDVVATNFRGSNVVVRLNDGTGHLSAETAYPVGAGSTDVQLGDMDGDGDRDAVVACRDSLEVAVLLNDGTGVFGAPTAYETFSPHKLDLADLDGDGDRDVVVANDDGGYVVLFYNDGTGTLTFELGPFLGNDEPAGDVATGDLDGDGDLDLAVARRDAGNVLIAINENGAFVADETYQISGVLQALTIDDLDGDGDGEVIVAGRANPPLQTSVVVILRNQGDASFVIDDSLDTALLYGPVDVRTADVDADGDPDLAMATSFGAAVATNDGTGSFEVAPTYSTQRLIVETFPGSYAHRTRPWSVVPADMDGDGAVDLVAANGGNWVPDPTNPANFFGYVSILQNDGTGKYGSTSLHGVGDGDLDGPAFVAMADLDFDGASDIVVANPDSNDVSVLFAWALDIVVEHPRYPVGPEPTALAIGDLDGDELADVVVANRADASVSVLRGPFGGPFAQEDRFDAFILPVSVALGDIDGDGDLDVVVGHEFGASVSLLRNEGGDLLPYELIDTGSDDTHAVTLHDVDGDAAPDLIVASQGAYWNDEPGVVSVMRNTGSGGFVLASSQPVGLNAVSVAVADFDRDGRPDIAVLTESNAEVSVLTNLGDATFGPPAVTPGETDARHGGHQLITGDVDLDGRADIVTANGDFSVSVLLNRNGGFARDEYLPTSDNSPIYGTVWEATSVALGDINGDGRPELATTDASTDLVAVTRNISDTDASCPADIDGGRSVGFGDLTVLINAWGTCPGNAPTCAGDLDGNGTVGFSDLQFLLQAWGPCDTP